MANDLMTLFSAVQAGTSQAAIGSFRRLVERRHSHHPWSAEAANYAAPSEAIALRKLTG
jgi:hypothetical protein